MHVGTETRGKNQGRSHEYSKNDIPKEGHRDREPHQRGFSGCCPWMTGKTFDIIR
jgi:hypothetical protein